jgi:hypothetical protein
MQRNKFPVGVAERLGFYVYRLIDPRNGETFYVGKGKGDRIFQHAKGILSADTSEEDAADLKLQRIKDISAAGLEVCHVIHRHNIESEELAFQIEAALMDAYPGLSNEVGGHGSGDYGVRHVEELITEYAAEEFEPKEKLILISIPKSYEEEGRDIYNAVRGVWKINPAKAKEYKLVLAHRRGLVLGAFRPKEWVPVTKENFRWLDDEAVKLLSKRWGFVGEPAEGPTANSYVRKRVPDKYRTKGARGPIRYVEPSPG